ncbi:unnamed protein product [Cylindrotheca closterium]|uniref:Uncharacterized protein n=1 Tax=Cylindrotheca closterium TaxID=2856 RepID=A0AAD2CY03_9STRA|nr:unnamed protein product [Cylindrotheca closterium]
MSAETDTSLIDEAEQAAKSAAVEWIREALRETFMQGLKSVWKVTKDEEEDYTIQLSPEGFESCLSLVEDLSNRWKNDLAKTGHTRTGEWVMEVFLQGKPDLWTKPILTSTTEPSKIPATATANGDPEKNNAQEENELEQNQEGDHAQKDGDQATPPSSQKIPYCKLRRLCRKVHIDDQLPENPLEILQNMGRRGESYWPLDWKLIEDAAKMERPKRRAPQKNAVGDDDDDVDNPDMPPPPAKRQKVDAEIVGRPATDLSSIGIFSDDFSEEEKERIRAEYIHPEPSDNSSDSSKGPPLVLFGAIQKVGNINYHKRHHTEWTEKKVNRERNAAIAERLYPNKLDSNLNVRTYRSKVLKTKSRFDESEQYIDMDMGWSLMEVRDPDNESEKRLCAFSSVEVRLEEKSKDADGLY